VVICLERGADLHTAQLMPLPLTISCFSKIQIGFAFLVPTYLGSPGQRAVKRVCVCVRACVRVLLSVVYILLFHVCFLLCLHPSNRWDQRHVISSSPVCVHIHTYMWYFTYAHPSRGIRGPDCRRLLVLILNIVYDCICLF